MPNELEFNLATTCIKTLASTPNADEQIKLVLHELFSSIIQKNSNTASENVTPIQTENPCKQPKSLARERNYLSFTQKESISKGHTACAL